MQIKAVLCWAIEALTAYTSTARLEAERLLAYCLQLTPAQLLAYDERLLCRDSEFSFRNLIRRRQDGEPIAYLVGEQEFWSLPLQVTPVSLIPRPETELLVSLILEHYPSDSAIKLVDLGTGSGAIALALAHERPHWKIIATDCSLAALTLARTNAKNLGIGNVEFRHGDWCHVFTANECFYGIVSNPPYLALNDPHLKTSLHYEPKIALLAGQDGLSELSRIITQAKQQLLPEGRLWLEHGYDQSESVAQLFKKNAYMRIEQFYDLSSILRVSMGICPYRE